MTTRSTSRPASGEERRSAANVSGAQLKQAKAATMPDARAASLAQFQHQERASNSSQAAQLKARANVMAGRKVDAPVQRVEDEELLQGKFAVAQREEDEELLQGKFAPAQRVEDGELLQGKFTTVQCAEDEELLQGKFDPVQRMEDEELLQGKFAARPTVQLEATSNNTGMPNQLKSDIESLSGMSMDHVKVHYNSDKPAQLNAHAYAQGSDIHMAPGQEQHLPHEAWHVVQQMQGRVRPTMQMKGDVQVNDDVGLETEADVMGEKMLQAAHTGTAAQRVANCHMLPAVVQRVQELPKDENSVGKLVVSVNQASHYGEKGEVIEYDEDAIWPITVKFETGETAVYTDLDLRLATNEAATSEVDAVQTNMPEKAEYRLYKSKGPDDEDWVRLNLAKQEDGSLLAEDSTSYRLLNIKFGDDKPFVSRETEKKDAEPTPDFIKFLEGCGFEMQGKGTIQDRVHDAIVHAQVKDAEKLSDHLSVDQNGKWYTERIRQGGLNELILTSDSVKAVARHTDTSGAKDRYGMKDGKKYTFVELQRDTSYPTKDFVFKETYQGEDGTYQNSHVNGRMYYVDGDGKKHKTVGPVSPKYHLAITEFSLKFHFEKRTTMKSLVHDLYKLHKNYLANKEDILAVKANKRGEQVYEMRGGDVLKLDDPAHLAIFADIVQNHTNSVLQQLKDVHASLEDVPDGVSSPRAPLSPTNYPSIQSPNNFEEVNDAK